MNLSTRTYKMTNIKQLPNDLIAQIAAGEVIDRPASAIKELIDNAIDAQADLIKIELENAGQKKIKITDNGIGMNKEDLQVCFLPHTTSKIDNMADLSNILTLGFRGEALSSIASISTVNIASRPKDQTGLELIIDNGKVIEIKPIGIAPGTQITISNLFANVPARKKFLKKPATELKQIIDLVTTYSLTYPQISFLLTNNDKVVLELTCADQIKNRLIDSLGRKITKHLIPIHFSHSIFNISGWIGDPQIARFNKSKQYLYVNNRPVSSSIISKKIKKIYGGLLEPKAQPSFIISIDLPASFVDANIHPRKKNVRFWDEDYLLTLLNQIISTALEKANLAGDQPNYSNINSLLELNDNNFQNRDLKSNQYLSGTLKEIVSAWETTQTRDNQQILQIHDLYLVTQTNQGMLIVDQHAAHERILYQQFLNAYQDKANQSLSKKLTSPTVIELSLADARLLEQNLPTFTKLGFEISNLDQNNFQITHIPNHIDPNMAEKIIVEVLDDLINGDLPRQIDSSTHRTIAFLSCRSAIKQGDSLSQNERKNLLEKLAQTELNYTCPHGRPTHIILSMSELEKMFHRRK